MATKCWVFQENVLCITRGLNTSMQQWEDCGQLTFLTYLKVCHYPETVTVHTWRCILIFYAIDTQNHKCALREQLVVATFFYVIAGVPFLMRTAWLSIGHTSGRKHWWCRKGMPSFGMPPSGQLWNRSCSLNKGPHIGRGIYPKWNLRFLP